MLHAGHDNGSGRGRQNKITCSVRRSYQIPKLYFDVEVTTNDVDAQYGPGFDAVFKDLGVVVYQIAPNLLSRDPGFRGIDERKRMVPFWDVLRYTCHGKAAVACCNTSLQLLVTRGGMLPETVDTVAHDEQLFAGPKVIIDSVLLSYASGKLGVKLADLAVNQPQFTTAAQIEYAKPESLFRIPGCDVNITMTWECDGNKMMHHLYPMRYHDDSDELSVAYTNAPTATGDWSDAFDRFRAKGLRTDIKAKVLPRLKAVLYSNALESLLYLGRVYGPVAPMPIQPIKSPEAVRHRSWLRQQREQLFASCSASTKASSPSISPSHSAKSVGRVAGKTEMGISVNNIAAFALLDLVAITREISISRVQVHGMDAWVYERAPVVKRSTKRNQNDFEVATDHSPGVCLSVDALSVAGNVQMVTRRKRRGVCVCVCVRAWMHLDAYVCKTHTNTSRYTYTIGLNAKHSLQEIVFSVGTRTFELSDTRVSVRGIHGSVMLANTRRSSAPRLHDEGCFLLGVPRVLISIASTNSGDGGNQPRPKSPSLQRERSRREDKVSQQPVSEVPPKSESSLLNLFGLDHDDQNLHRDRREMGGRHGLRNFESSGQASASLPSKSGSFLTSVEIDEPHILLTLETRNSIYDIADAYVKTVTTFVRKSGARPDDLIGEKEVNGSSISSSGSLTPKSHHKGHRRKKSITKLATGELKVEDITQKVVSREVTSSRTCTIAGEGIATVGDITGDGDIHPSPAKRLANGTESEHTLSQRKMDIAEASLEFSADEKASLVDIFALYITAPQINLTDNQNGGCLLLAMSGVGIEGRQSKYADVETVSLTASAVQSFVAPTDVDVKVHRDRRGMWLVRADQDNQEQGDQETHGDENDFFSEGFGNHQFERSHRRYSQLTPKFGVLKPIIPNPFPVQCVLSIHHGVDVENERFAAVGNQVGNDVGSAADHSKRAKMIHRSNGSGIRNSPHGVGDGTDDPFGGVSSVPGAVNHSANTLNDAEIKQMTKIDGILAELLLQNDVVVACEAEQLHIILNVIVNILTPPVPKVEARLDETQRFMLQQQLKMRKKLIDTSLNATDPASIALADQMLENEWVAKRALQWEISHLERLLSRLQVEKRHIAGEIARKAEEYQQGGGREHLGEGEREQKDKDHIEYEYHGVKDNEGGVVSQPIAVKPDMSNLMSSMITPQNGSQGSQQMRKHSVLLSSVREELMLREDKLAIVSETVSLMLQHARRRRREIPSFELQCAIEKVSVVLLKDGGSTEAIESGASSSTTSFMRSCICEATIEALDVRVEGHEDQSGHFSLELWEIKIVNHLFMTDAINARQTQQQKMEKVKHEHKKALSATSFFSAFAEGIGLKDSGGNARPAGLVLNAADLHYRRVLSRFDDGMGAARGEAILGDSGGLKVQNNDEHATERSTEAEPSRGIEAVDSLRPSLTEHAFQRRIGRVSIERSGKQRLE